MNIEEKHRVFFSIRPDEEALAQILALQKMNTIDKARFLSSDHIHLTLLFLGNLDKKSLVCIQQAARQIRLKSLHLRFNQTGGFRKTGILWLGSEFSDQNLIELYRKLCEQASNCAIKTETRPYKAHITLARKFYGKHFTNPERPIHFTATHFHLMESVPVQGGVNYQILESYPLTN